MCRSIKVLRRPGEIATREEVQSAALQFVRKISGFHKPSKLNQAVFDQAVREITDAGERLLNAIDQSSARPKSASISASERGERTLRDANSSASG